MRVSFHELAERELNDAAIYYERESHGLGGKFLDEVERYIEAIVQNPNAGAKVRGEILSAHPSNVSVRHPLFGARKRHPSSRCHELEAKTDVLDTPILKRAAEQSAAARMRYEVILTQHGTADRCSARLGCGLRLDGRWDR